MNKFKHFFWSSICSTVVIACNISKVNSKESVRLYSDYAKSKVTINTGLYGMTYMKKSDTYELLDTYSGFQIVVKGDSGEDTIYTDENGFYQIELPKGNYRICSADMTCMKWALDTILQRCDYEQTSMFKWNCYAMAPKVMIKQDSIKYDIQWHKEQ